MSAGGDEMIRRLAVEAIDLRFAALRLPRPLPLAKLGEWMDSDAFSQPVLVSSAVAAGELVLVDGFKRIEAARQLGQHEVLARVVALDAVAAQVTMLRLGESRRGLGDFEQGLIVHSLHRQHHVSQMEIAALLRRHPSWVCRRLRLVEHLESGVQQDLRLGLISASVARELVRLPRGNQEPVAQAITGHGLSVRQAKCLIERLTKADPGAQREILRAPLEHISAPSAASWKAPAEGRLSAQGNHLRRYLAQAGAASTRLIEALATLDAARLTDEEVGILADLAAAVLPAVQRALARIATILSEAATASTRRTEDVASP